ncbi:hypothetical protein ACOMHN_044413 [Nucella lapillus]
MCGEQASGHRPAGTQQHCPSQISENVTRNSQASTQTAGNCLQMPVVASATLPEKESTGTKKCETHNWRKKTMQKANSMHRSSIHAPPSTLPRDFNPRTAFYIT